MDRFTLNKKLFFISTKKNIAVFVKIMKKNYLNILFKYFYLNITTEYINE